jgi:GT2 family glycosyltransferase
VEIFGQFQLDMVSPQVSEPRPVIDDISVVIPTLGRSILGECLFWLVSGTHWPAELIIVDQGSSYQAAAWVERLNSLGFSAQYLPSSQRGRAAGINRGLEKVQTQFVAITDDDCFPGRTWLCSMAAHLIAHPEAIITGRVEPAGEGEVDFCVVTSTESKVHMRPRLKVQPLIGGNMGVSIENVSRIGLYDEHPTVFAAEDNDWGYRALRSNVPIRYEPDTIVFHYGWRNPDQRAQRYRDYSRSQGGFYGKHLRQGDLFIGWQAARDLARGPLRWLRGRMRNDQDMIDRGKADTLELLPGILSGLLRKSAHGSGT